MKKPHKIFIVAGEASGDLLAANLVKAIRDISPKTDFQGVGGQHSREAGIKLVASYDDIAIMGFFEVLPRLFTLVKRLKQVEEAIKQFKPDVLVTIDAPGFNFRLAKRIRKYFGADIKIVHYVAPTVWAYKPKRAEIVAKLYDHILLLLPFEKPYFKHMPSTFIGHPITEVEPVPPANDKLKAKYGITKELIPVIVMPGSRKTEVIHMAKILVKALELVNKSVRLKILIPTLSHIHQDIEREFKGLDVIISTNSEEKNHFLQLAKFALVKSGTSTLEMTYHNIPFICVYRTSSITYFYIKRLVKIKFITLTNILLNKGVVTELIQENCTPTKIAEALYKLINSPQNQYTIEFKKAISLLRPREKSSTLAAKVILKLL